jgi:hypothetical protein
VPNIKSPDPCNAINMFDYQTSVIRASLDLKITIHEYDNLRSAICDVNFSV